MPKVTGETVSAAEYNALEQTILNADYGVTIDGVSTSVLVNDPGQNVNGFVFKGNAVAESGYGQGQAFLVLEPGTGDATDQTAAGSVVFRVDRMGNVGTTGGLHVATGMRWDDAAMTQAVWIDPSDNMVGLIITNPETTESATWDKDFLIVRNVRGTEEDYFKVTATGFVQGRREITARVGAATRTAIGDTYGFAGIAMGDLADTALYRADAGIVGVANVFHFAEQADPAAGAANSARLYARDNGSGKTQLCVRFNTGAIQVIATQP